MDQHAVEMVASRVQGEELVVESVRKPGQRVPIRRVGGRKRPFYGAPRQTAANMEIEVT